jgi:hypothetical protein
MKDENIRKQQEIDQTLQMTLDIMPGFYWSAFNRYKEAGFTEQQAFAMILAAIAGAVKQ